MFEDIKHAIVADRQAYFDDFFANFYDTDVLALERIGDAALRASFVEVENGPHNIGWTHSEETNTAMIEFLNGEAKADTASAATAPLAATSA